MYGFASTRRREFGRRRALGARRTQLVLLVVAQTALTGGVGASAGALLGARVTEGVSLSFMLAVAVLSTAASALAAVVPATAAARRDPVAVLRQP